MKFITEYSIKPFLPKAEQKRMIDLFATHGVTPGTTAHYLAADGSKGWTITDTEQLAEAYEIVTKYDEYIEFHTIPVLEIDEALPILLKSLPN